MQFKLGDSVSWHNRPYDPPHKGFIVAIVPPHNSPRKVGIDHGFKPEMMDFGSPRDEESYIVHEPSKSRRGHGKLFWPRVSALMLAEREKE